MNEDLLEDKDKDEMNKSGNKVEPEEQKEAQQDFGFGEPETTPILDPNVFEEEVDVKKAFKYDEGQRFEEGVETEFEKMGAGAFFMEGDMEQDEPQGF